MTPWSESSLRISVSDDLRSSFSEITPRIEFKVPCGVMHIENPRIFVARRNDLVCTDDKVSIKKSPDFNFLMDFGNFEINSK